MKTKKTQNKTRRVKETTGKNKNTKVITQRKQRCQRKKSQNKIEKTKVKTNKSRKAKTTKTKTSRRKIVDKLLSSSAKNVCLRVAAKHC